MEAAGLKSVSSASHERAAEWNPRFHNGSFENLLKEARELSWRNLGKKITFYLPGMIKYGSERGSYPAISITGAECELGCEHCRGKILAPMVQATTPDALVRKCRTYAEQGAIGCLLTGGSDRRGIMPWERFADAISKVKHSTGLHLSIHTGIMPKATARRLKAAGVDQALIDLIGSDDTVREVYHLDGGVELIRDSMRALSDAGIEMAPHIVVGLHYGNVLGEYRAIEMAREFGISTLVFVVLTPFRGGPMEGVASPSAEEVAELIATARLKLPRAVLSLGCERSRGKEGQRTELLAIDAGVNRIAIQSDAAIERAERYGLDIRYQKSCCSLGLLPESS
jgi:uncharacterized radical SAM superfamily protein